MTGRDRCHDRATCRFCGRRKGEAALLVVESSFIVSMLSTFSAKILVLSSSHSRRLVRVYLSPVGWTTLTDLVHQPFCTWNVAVLWLVHHAGDHTPDWARVCCRLQRNRQSVLSCSLSTWAVWRCWATSRREFSASLRSETFHPSSRPTGLQSLRARDHRPAKRTGCEDD